MSRMHKYGETKTTRIMMATVRHVTSSSGLRKFQAAWFLLNRGYIDILCRLRDAVRKPRKMENQQLVSSSKQCFSTPVGFGQGFLSKEQCDNIGASPILSWPSYNWFLPVTSKEISIEGTALLCYTDIIKNATEELKRLSQDVFQEYLQHLYSRRQKCIVAH
jgi:hypothetical protein